MKTAGKQRWTKDVFEIVLAFAAAWIFYQLLGVALQTSTPIVSVASQSMFHEKGFDQWWEESAAFYESAGISREKFMQFPNRNGLDKGDILLVVRSGNPVPGDIAVYRPQKGCFSIDETIVHRIVKAENGKYITKGDKNPAPDRCPVDISQIEGRSVLAVPLLGYPRLVLEEFLKALR